MYDFHITPKSEDELSDLLPEGKYPYQIVKSTSQAKEECMQMIWKLKFWDQEGVEHYITDFLKVDQSSKFCMRKIRHALYSCGCGDFWEKGKWNASDFDNKTGYLLLGVQKEGYGKDGKFYPTRNNIKDYLKDDSDLKDSINILEQRRNAVNRNSGDLPPVDVYDDIPL